MQNEIWMVVAELGLMRGLSHESAAFHEAHREFI
jgi:hypothetical protein